MRWSRRLGMSLSSGISFTDPRNELEEFIRIGYTIGGMMSFPGNRVDGQMTINAARGFHPRIKDRFDLTVECIRRHYGGADSPLARSLHAMGTSSGCSATSRVRGVLPAAGPGHRGCVQLSSSSRRLMDFTTSPASGTAWLHTRAYQQLAIEFIEAREPAGSCNGSRRRAHDQRPVDNRLLRTVRCAPPPYRTGCSGRSAAKRRAVTESTHTVRRCLPWTFHGSSTSPKAPTASITRSRPRSSPLSARRCGWSRGPGCSTSAAARARCCAPGHAITASSAPAST